MGRVAIWGLCLGTVLILSEPQAAAQQRFCFDMPSCQTSQSCNRGGDQGCGRCCKIIMRRNVFGSTCFGPPAPAAGVVVSSVPALTVATPALPLSFGAVSAGGMSESDVARVAAAAARDVLAASGGDRAGAASAGAVSNRCDDPCADIKQLQHDVEHLRQITRNLAVAVDALVDRLNNE